MNVLNNHGTKVLLNHQLYKKSKKITSIGMERNILVVKNKRITFFLVRVSLHYDFILVAGRLSFVK